MSAFGDHHRAGSGPPLLLVHGFTATWHAWGPVRELLEEQFDVLAPTSPGHTDGPDLPEGHPVEGMVAGLEAMMDEVGWSQAHLAGFSLGGQLALELATRGRALSVTAVAPGGAHGSELDREIARIARLFRRQHKAATTASRLAARLNRSGALRRVIMRDTMYDGSKLSADEANALTDAFAATPVFAPFLEAVAAGERTLDGLDRIDAPVTIAWGDTDRILPQDRHEPFFRRHLPDARYVTFKKAGHVPFWEAPERVANVIAQTALAVERSAART